MSESEPPRAIQRILVALDASPHSMAALKAAVELAASLKAELLGLFVEDINLLRLAEFPFAQEIGRYSARRRKLDSDQMARRLRAQASWARQAFARMAEEAAIQWSFRVTRGAIDAELISATSETDLIILGKTGWSNLRRPGSTAIAVISRGPQRILVLQEGAQLGLAVFVLFDQSPHAMEALTLAADFARDRQGHLTVMLIARAKELALELQEQAEAWLKARGQYAAYRWLSEVDPAIVCRLVQVEDGGMLVVPAQSPQISDDDLLQILSDITCPVLLVRQAASAAD